MSPIDILREWNFAGFHFLNGFLGYSFALDWLILFCAQYLLYIVIILSSASLLFHFYRFGRRCQVRALVVLGTLLGALSVRTLFRLFYEHPRPYHIFDTPYLFTGYSFSFPSGHTIFIIALATATYWYHKPLGIFFGILGVITGIARVASGVHYPLDIIGGIGMGVAIGIFAEYLTRYIAKR